MRTGILLLAIAGSGLVLSEPASACSVRGTYCGYPSWAANAFDRYGFKGNPRTLTYYYPDFSSRKAIPTQPRVHKRYR